MATLPAAFVAALAQPGAASLYWIEIEGLPYAYGNRAQASAFWASLPLAEQFAEIRPYLPAIPGGVDARLDPLEGMASPGEFQFSVVDADGYLTQAANVGREDADADALYLTADALAGAVTLNVGGNLAAWPASGTGYIGRTTFSYTGKGTGTLTGVTMGRYRSPSILHTQGEPVTQYPVHLKTRRAWFYLALSTTGTFSIADRVTRYAGAIDDYYLAGGSAAELTTWALVVRTPEKEFGDTTLFRDLRSGTLKTSLPGEARTGVEYQKVDDGDPGVARDADTGAVVLGLARSDLGGAGGFVADEWVYLRIEDEIVSGRWDATAGRLASIHRGLYGTRVVAHSYQAEWREGVSIVASDATGIPEATHSKFTAGDRPEEIVLQLLCGSGTYGVLPEAWNAGFEAARVDVASFEAVRDEAHAGEHLVAWVDEPVAFRDLVVEHLLKPWGLYLVHGTDDKVRLGYLRQGPPATTVATIDHSNVVAPPSWKSGADKTVGEYRLECDLDVLGGISGDPGTLLVDVFVDTGRLYSRQKVQTIVHRSLFAHYSSGTSDPAGGYRKALRTFDSRRAFFSGQYGRPPPSLTVRCLFSLFPVQPGDSVTVSLPEIPSMTGAARGYVGPAFVASKRPSDHDAVVEFELLLLGAALDRYAIVAHSIKIATWNSATATATLTPDAFGLGGGGLAFEVNDLVVVVSPNFAAVLPGRVGFSTADQIGVAMLTSDAAQVAPGWYIVPADYASTTAAQKARKLAALADATEKLNGVDRAYRYSGI